jgi:hypothetical protein
MMAHKGGKKEHVEAVKPAKEAKKKSGLLAWQIVVIVLGVALIGSIATQGFTTIKKAAAKTGSEDQFIFLNSDACTTACDEMEPVVKEMIAKTGLEYTNAKYSQAVQIPGFILVKDGTITISGIQDKGTFATQLCTLTSNTDVCNEAKTATDDAAQQAAQAQQQELATTPKMDKPVVELFVMSHCPYGTQIEKGALPVAELLGSKIDFSVKFVYYAMHGKTELDEQTLQYCIQKEQKDKYLKYLACFLEAGKTADCITKTAIDKAKADACVAATDKLYNITGKFNDQTTWLSGRFPVFDIYKDLNTKYAVQGSPTFVLNGKQVNAGRDSASLLKAVCAGFNTQPAECSQTLSSAQPAAGFGGTASATASGTAATCG